MNLMKAIAMIVSMLLIALFGSLQAQEPASASDEQKTIASGFRGVQWDQPIPVTYSDPSASIPVGFFPAFDLLSIPEDGASLFLPMDRSLFVSWAPTFELMSILTFELEGHLESHLNHIFPYYFEGMNESYPDLSKLEASSWVENLNERYPSWKVEEQAFSLDEYGFNVMALRAIVPWSKESESVTGRAFGYEEAMLRTANSLNIHFENGLFEKFQREEEFRANIASEMESAVSDMIEQFKGMPSNEVRMAKLESLRETVVDYEERYFQDEKLQAEGRSPEHWVNFLGFITWRDMYELAQNSEDDGPGVFQDWEPMDPMDFMTKVMGPNINPTDASKWKPTFTNSNRFLVLEDKPKINHRTKGGIDPVIAGTPLEAQADPTVHVIPPPTYLVACNDNASSNRAIVVTTGNFGDLGEGSLMYGVTWDLMPPLEVPVSDSELEPGSSDESQMLYFMEADMGSQNFKPAGIKESMDELLGTLDIHSAVQLQESGYSKSLVGGIHEFYPMTWKVHPERIADDNSFLRQWVSTDAKLSRSTRMWTSGEDHELICSVDSFGSRGTQFIHDNHPAHAAIIKLINDATEELGEPEVKDGIATPYSAGGTTIDRRSGERMGWLEGTGLVWNHPTGNLMIKNSGKIDLKDIDTGPLHPTVVCNGLEYTVRDTGIIQVLVDKSAPQADRRRDANGTFVWANLRVANQSVDTPASLGAKPVLVNRSIDRTYSAMTDESRYHVGMKDIYAGLMAGELEDRAEAEGWSQIELRDLMFKDGIGHDQLNIIEPETSRDFWIIFEVPMAAIEKQSRLDLVLDGGDGPALPLIGIEERLLFSRKMAQDFEIFGMSVIGREPLAREFKNLDLTSISGNIQIWRSTPKMQEALSAAKQQRNSAAEEARRKAEEQKEIERKQAEEALGDL
ncbi:MAG: hypothetical protein CMJ39_00675 [Phycisphaerae bacterium]|nr:hypothetical protein [Phycisphaerae bacterium]